MKPIRLLVVDDEARVRQGLRMLMATEPDLEVVGEAGDGPAALHLALELRPDVVLMDLLMSGMDGIHATRLLQAAVPASSIVAFSVREDVSTRRAAAAAGAAAFVGKQEGPERLLATIREAGGCYPSPGIAVE